MRNRITKAPILIVFALLLAVIMTGCVALEQQPSPMETPAAGPETTGVPAEAAEATPPAPTPPVTPISPEKAASLWNDIQEEGVMMVGVSSGYPPFSYYGPDGQLDGFDIALMRELGQRLGVKIVFQDMPFDQLLNKVQAGELDAAISAIAITPERQQRVAFTAPYYKGNVAILTTADATTTSIQTVEDLAKLKVGAELGTSFADWLRTQVENGVIARENVSLYPTIDQAMRALVEGKIDAVMADGFTANDIARQTHGQLQLINKNGKVLLTYTPLFDKPLHGVEWQLVSYANGEGALIPVLTGSSITAHIRDAVMKGSAGCNTYSADLLVDASRIDLTTPVTTRKTCAEPEGVMDQENRYLANLMEASSYEIKGDTLIFNNKNHDPILIFKARPQVDVANITWQLYAYGNVFKPQPVPQNVNVTLDATKDGDVSGSSGCNNYSGKVTIDGDAISFELGAATTKACDPAANDMESIYLGALAGAERAEVQQDQLIIYYNGGLDALKFRAHRKNPLQFTDWQLLTFGPPDKGSRPLSTTQLTALFDKDKLSGSAGCNDFSTTYAVKGNTINIGKIALTRMLCSATKVNKQEINYVRKLRNSKKYRFTGISVTTSELYEQYYAIAVPAGADELLDRLNDGLAQLDQEQVITRLAQRYLSLEPVAEEKPQPQCTDKLKWIADITYDDHNMHKPPVVEPGTPFQKVWRVKNVGTCTWTTDYYLDFHHGNKPGADMKGGRSYIDAEVKPGETYDLKLDLIAPIDPGVYQGFWNFNNASGHAFAQLWVGIKVPKPATPIPTPTATPTATPVPVVQFTSDHTHIQQGACTTLYWNAQNVAHAYLFEEGEDWQDKEVPQQGSKEVCPEQTTTYNLGVELMDGARHVSTLTIQVTPVAPPEIVEFRSQPEGSVVIGNAVTLYWDVRGDVLEVTLLANDVPLLSQAPAYGQFVHTPSHLGEVRYTLQAQGPGGAIVQDVVIQVTEVQPTPEPPTPTPEPPTPTPEPPTPTPEPPTPTPVPPTETPVPPTATPEPPTPTPSPAPGQDLRDKNWILENMTKAKMAPQPVLENSQINIFFDPSGSFNGNAGCNDYAGVYVVGEDNALTLTMGQVTNMTCDDPPGVMEQEHQYLQLLANVKSYLIDEGGYLNLYTEDQWTLTYRMGPTPR